MSPQVGADEATAQQGGRAKDALLAVADGETAPSLDSVVRKVAWRLIPILFVAYVINFIDRMNISFVKLQMGPGAGAR